MNPRYAAESANRNMIADDIRDILKACLSGSSRRGIMNRKGRNIVSIISVIGSQKEFFYTPMEFRFI